MTEINRDPYGNPLRSTHKPQVIMESKLFRRGIIWPAAFLLWLKAVTTLAYYAVVTLVMLSPSGVGV